jgi:putative transposase
LSINRACKLLGLSKNTYYNAKDPKEAFCDKYAYVRTYVEKVIEKNSSYGIRRLKQALLDEYRIVVGRDVLGKLLKYWGMNLKRKRKKHKPSIIQCILRFLGGRSNLLIRTKITSCLQAITSDMSELVYAGGKAYFVVHKDAYGQVVYGWNVSLSASTSTVLKSFHRACNRIRSLNGLIPKKVICHQDQGSVYTSYEYVEEVQNQDMLLSYSKKGTPTENPGQESFFGRFKDEWADEIREIETIEELEKFVNEKMKYYNEQRLHTSINYMSPVSFTRNLLEKHKNRFTFLRT